MLEPGRCRCKENTSHRRRQRSLLPAEIHLEKEGFAFAGAHTGRGALDLCRCVRPDLILLDIMLPDSDGLDICKGIRNDAQLSRTPIIFLTARASETDRIVGLELGANDYIVKPFSSAK